MTTITSPSSLRLLARILQSEVATYALFCRFAVIPKTLCSSMVLLLEMCT
jgi:hypothetical protein